jgi:hypothetical protein
LFSFPFLVWLGLARGRTLPGDGLGFVVERIDFPLQCVGLEDPPRAIAFPAILHAADFANGLFGGHEYGQVIPGVSVYVAFDPGEVGLSQFICSLHLRFLFVCCGVSLQ